MRYLHRYRWLNVSNISVKQLLDSEHFNPLDSSSVASSSLCETPIELIFIDWECGVPIEDP